MHCENGSVRRRDGEFFGEPVELLIGNFTPVSAGHRRVEGNHPKTVDVVDAVDRA
jgi:hypothetical protein